MADDSVAGRVQTRLLITDEGGRVLAVGEPPALPGGPIGTRPDLSIAASEEAYFTGGVTARVGRPLAVTVTRESGLTLVFDARVEDIGTARFVDPRLVPAAAEALRGRSEGRIRYVEQLWWPVQPSGSRGRFPSGLGTLLKETTDDDIACWSLGVLLGVFPTDRDFFPFRSVWQSKTEPRYESGEALHRVLMALARAGVLDEDAALEFAWSSLVDVSTG